VDSISGMHHSQRIRTPDLLITSQLTIFDIIIDITSF